MARLMNAKDPLVCLFAHTHIYGPASLNWGSGRAQLLSGCWGSELLTHVCTASALPTDPSPDSVLS